MAQGLNDTFRGINLKKFTVGICLLFATVLLVVVTVTQSSAGGGGHSKKEVTLLKKASGASSEDLTIVGWLGQSPGQQDDNRISDEGSQNGEDGGPTVRIRRQGKVKGTILKSREGRDYFAFYQVPYAADPVGELRFELPQKPKRWRGVRDATRPGVECLQKEKYAVINTTGGAEACLHLNIYTPGLPQRRNKVSIPVLFYLHGGEPYGNGTRYGAKYFMDEDVVLVTIEFRLGAFGSFVTPSGSFSGNQGFKDQVFALEWVQRNIEKFGGNKDKVMIFGNSGGSGAVHAHLLSTMSQGLYHRAVMQSGSTILRDMTSADPIGNSRRLALYVGCEGPLVNGTEEELLTCLRQVDAKTMAMSPASLLSAGVYPDIVGEADERKKLRRNEIFLRDSTWNLAHQDINSVPLILGLVGEENMHGDLSLLLTNDTATKALNDDWNDIISTFIGFQDDENHTMAQQFRQLYFGDQPISNETRVNLYHLQSDSFMNHACRLSGMLYANQSTSPPVYFYWMTKEPAKSYAENIKNVFPPPYGPAHADELQYLFLYDGYPEVDMESPWFNFSKTMVQLWVSFADTGKPTPPAPIQWPPIDLRDEGMKWFQLDDEMKIVEPFTQRMQLWDQYTDQLYGVG